MASPDATVGSSSSSTTNGTAEPVQLLTASYTSPTHEPFSYGEKIPSPATTAPTDRAAYLAQLRAATLELQKTINAELTQRMEEDKRRAAEDAGDAGRRNGLIDEGKEEENYGEEVVEEEG